MTAVEFMGGPRDGEVRSVPSPAPYRIEFPEMPDIRAVGQGEGLVPVIVGAYVRSSDLRYRGTMVRYDWRRYEKR